MPKMASLYIPREQVEDLASHFPETCMGFQVARLADDSIVIISSDGLVIACYKSSFFFDIYDLLSETNVPEYREERRLKVLHVFPDRKKAGSALAVIEMKEAYLGAVCGIRMQSRYLLASDQRFYRLISASTDLRYNSGKLQAGSYMTSKADMLYANTGLAAVSRFALPIPRPASHIFEYEIPKDTEVKVGAISPVFGQAGGGVEVLLDSKTPARFLGYTRIVDY